MRALIAVVVILVSSVASADPITPERRAALDAFIASQDLERVWAGFLEASLRNAPEEISLGARDAVLKQTDISEAQKARIVAAVRSASNDMAKEYAAEYGRLDLPGIVREMVYEAYGTRFSTAEITQVTAFYQSPTGKKTLHLTATIIAEEKAGIKDVMQRHFSQAEIQEIIRFSQSPLGKRMQDPMLQRDMRAIARRHIQPINDRVVQKFQARIRTAAGQ